MRSGRFCRARGCCQLGGGDGRGEGVAYGPSVQVKTWVKPQDRTWASESVWGGGAVGFMVVEGVVDG